MRKRNRKQQSSDSGSEWLTTYSDMVTLLLCFFVLLYAFSNLDQERFSGVMASFRGGSGVLEGGNTISQNIEEQNLGILKEIIEEYAEENNLESGITVSIEDRGLIIRLKDNVLFDPGKADLKPESKEILFSIAEILQKEEFVDKSIKVEGHADTTPVNPADGYPTNWELSTARATNVLRYLVEENNIEGERISASGYSYYKPVVANDTPENKSKNRRVDIVILRSSSEEVEPE